MPRLGFKFNNKHSKDFGIIMLSKNRSLLPKPNLEYENIPGYGQYEFDDKSFEDRVIEVKCTFIEKDTSFLHIRKHEIANWLNTMERKQLIFDDETAIYYKARYFNDISLEQKLRNAKHGSFTLSFKCEPYAYSIVDSSKQFNFTQGIMFGYGYRFQEPTVYSNITGQTTVSVYNWGHVKVRPVIEITGSCDSLSISTGDQTYTYNTALTSEKLIIDGERYQTRIGEINKAIYATGNFLELEPGGNDIIINGTNLNLTEVKIIFEAKYL